MRFDAFVLMDSVSYCSVNCYKAKVYNLKIRCYICIYSFIPFRALYNKLSTRPHARMSLNRAFMLPWFYNAPYLNYRDVDVHINLLKEQQHRTGILCVSKYFYHIKDKYAIYVKRTVCIMCIDLNIL